MTRNGAPTPRFTPHCILAVRGEPSDIATARIIDGRRVVGAIRGVYHRARIRATRWLLRPRRAEFDAASGARVALISIATLGTLAAMRQ